MSKLLATKVSTPLSENVQIGPKVSFFCVATIIVQNCLKARAHQDEYRRALFASVFQHVFCVQTRAIFADDEPSEHANSFPDIRWRLM